MILARVVFVIHTVLFAAAILFAVYLFFLPTLHPAEDDLTYEWLTLEIIIMLIIGGYSFLFAVFSWLVKRSKTISEKTKMILSGLLFLFCGGPILSWVMYLVISAFLW